MNIKRIIEIVITIATAVAIGVIEGKSVISMHNVALCFGFINITMALIILIQCVSLYIRTEMVKNQEECSEKYVGLFFSIFYLIFYIINESRWIASSMELMISVFENFVWTLMETSSLIALWGFTSFIRKQELRRQRKQI